MKERLEYLRAQPWWRNFITQIMKQRTSNESTDIVHSLCKLSDSLVVYLNWGNNFDYWKKIYIETITALSKIQYE